MKFDQRECYGPCPTYSVEVHGNGDAIYTGKRYVAVQGVHRYKLPKRDVEAIFAAFEDPGFDSLKGTVALDDATSWVYTVSYDRKTKSLRTGQWLKRVDYAFQTNGRAEQWNQGNLFTVETLRAEGFDFHSQEAGAILTRAAILGDPNVVSDLLREKVPLNVETELKPSNVCWRRFEQTAMWLKAAGAKAGGCYP